MALTATCTLEARNNILTRLCMENAVHVCFSGDRPNILLLTALMPAKIDDWRPYLDEDISIERTLGVSTERRVYFCRSIEMACRLYEYYEDSLGNCAYFDPCGKLVPANRIIAMFHSESAESVKKAVCESLGDPNGIVRRVFATQSLSMGIDCPNIRHVVHWEVPRTLETYYQEIGRSGRDGAPAVATLLYRTGHLNDRFCSLSVQDFSANTSNECLRAKLMNYLVSVLMRKSRGHCCSVCNS